MAVADLARLRIQNRLIAGRCSPSECYLITALIRVAANYCRSIGRNSARHAGAKYLHSCPIPTKCLPIRQAPNRDAPVVGQITYTAGRGLEPTLGIPYERILISNTIVNRSRNNLAVS